MSADTFTTFQSGTHLAKPHNPSLEAEMNKSVSGTTDNSISVAGGAFQGIVGTWSRALGANGVPMLSKAANEEVGHAYLDIAERVRAAAGKGLQPVSVDLLYKTDTAALVDLDVLICRYDFSVASGTAPGRAILAGDADADYDAAHNTTAERITDAVHKLTVTIPENERAFLASARGLAIEVLASAAETSEFDIHGCVIHFERSDIDLR